MYLADYPNVVARMDEHMSWKNMLASVKVEFDL